MCTSVTPAVPYLLLGLQDVQRAVGNSRGARKLARTPHVNNNNNKKKTLHFLLYFLLPSASSGVVPGEEDDNENMVKH